MEISLDIQFLIYSGYYEQKLAYTYWPYFRFYESLNFLMGFSMLNRKYTSGFPWKFDVFPFRFRTLHMHFMIFREMCLEVIPWYVRVIVLKVGKLFIPMNWIRVYAVLALSFRPSVQNKYFCHIFNWNCWWQPLDVFGVQPQLVVPYSFYRFLHLY